MRGRVLAGASLFLVLSAWVAARGPQQRDARSTPAVEAALKKGEAALQAARFKDALSAFKHANELQKQQSVAAFFGISRAYRGLRDHKREADSATAGINLAAEDIASDRRLTAQLYNQLGLALAAQAKKPTDQEMKDAAQNFYWALTLDTIPIAWFNLGVALLQQGQDDAGREALEEYLRAGPDTPESELARKYFAEPRLAREAFGRSVRK